MAVRVCFAFSIGAAVADAAPARTGGGRGRGGPGRQAHGLGGCGSGQRTCTQVHAHIFFYLIAARDATSVYWDNGSGDCSECLMVTWVFFCGWLGGWQWGRACGGLQLLRGGMHVGPWTAR